MCSTLHLRIRIFPFALSTPPTISSFPDRCSYRSSLRLRILETRFKNGRNPCAGALSCISAPRKSREMVGRHNLPVSAGQWQAAKTRIVKVRARHRVDWVSRWRGDLLRTGPSATTQHEVLPNKLTTLFRSPGEPAASGRFIKPSSQLFGNTSSSICQSTKSTKMFEDQESVRLFPISGMVLDGISP